MVNIHFTCIGRGHGAPAVPATREDWEKMRKEPWLADMCRRIANGDEKLKSKLPIWTPSCAGFKNNHRAIADAEKPLNRLMLDFDEKGHSQEILEKCNCLQKEGKWEILLVEESVRKGTHVLVTLPEGMTPQEVQEHFSQDVGFQADPSLKDIARCIYMVPTDFTLYVNDALFSPQSGFSPQCTPSATESFLSSSILVIQSEAKNLENTSNGKTKVDAPEILRRDAPLDDIMGKENNPCKSVKSVVQSKTYSDTYEDIPYKNIVEVLEEQMGGLPDVGSRNNFIFSMACHLRYICNDDPAWIAQVLPDYGEERQRYLNTVKSACQRLQSKTMPRIVKRTLSICKQRMETDSELITHNSELNEPPPMPKRLPSLIKLLVSRTPKVYQSAVAQAVFPSLGAHLWKTTFRYIDNTLHEATLANVLMAPTGVGKSCICQPIDHIMADIRMRDKVNMERERKWKQEIQTKGANKDKKSRPEGIVIQEIDPDATSAAFVQRMADAEGRFLYARMNEIELFNNLSPRGNSKGHFQLMCLAFDYNNIYGQTRVGTGSVSERVCVRFNYNISTTIRKGQSYFRSVLTDGPISRINFCTIPERPIGSDMPVYGDYDDAFVEELSPYIERLNGACGLIECRQATSLAKKLMLENADFARLSQSRVYENLSFRANVIAFLKAMILYVAHGERWDKSMEDFVRWSLQYDMWCKMKFFGEAIENMECESERSTRRGPQNLLDLLPEVFTREEACLLRQHQGIRQGTVKSMLSNWKKRGYIELYGEEMPSNEASRQRYIKTESYLKDHPQKKVQG